ncbi:S41 family peptidase [Barnesiella sp. An55]|uniref:S41 family peptidase n=1 Tax=Barnesiella sp. An55 TaxID=1965646 RepID=UPI000B36BD67|nr:S41 family peptidase [Barnesiella sp. An55]OUN73248.1 peptidase S41 [Barnesiella sp. An55]
MKKVSLSIGLAWVLILGLGVANAAPAGKSDRRDFEVSRNLDIFNSLFKELNLFYVDTINAEKAIGDGVNAMLSRLDPYTEYIPEKDKDDFFVSTTGEYAGIGSIIVERDNAVYISEPYEGMPAQLAGLRPGDKIVMIDNDSVKGWKSSAVSERLKGPANTKLRVTVERPGVEGTLSFDITRKKVHMPVVPYYDVVCDSVGYIYLNSFTDSAADEVKRALQDLKRRGVTSLVLDLRGNGGGILEQAVQIVNLFVPKGVEVLSTRGRNKQMDKIYKTTQEPVDEHIPLAVLIDGGTASSSEIVAGSLQDLDRAVIIGSRSFGKGLVQSTRPLPYNGILKVTIARYYIPSGRLIQAIDYSHRNPDGSVARIPDSLTHEFKTAHGRIVRDGGGIKPDIETSVERRGNISYYLMRDFYFFDYANRYAAQHDTIAPAKEFVLPDSVYNDFKAFVKSKNFKYDKQSERILADLKEVAKFEGYFDENTQKQFEALEASLNHDLDRDLETFRDEIRQLLSIEIVKRYYYQKGEVIESIKNDKDLTEACAVLNDNARYSQLLNLSPKR